MLQFIFSLLVGVAANAATAPSCPPGYLLDNACGCAWQPYPCEVLNGVGSMQEDGLCKVESCNSGFHQSEAACVSDISSCAVPNGTGTMTWPSTECVPTSCKSGFELKAGACVAINIQTCSDLSAAQSRGKTINVSAGGSIQAAMNKAIRGDTIVLACGAYSQGGTLKTSGVANNWITIKSASSRCAKIYGQVHVYKSDFVRIEGLEIINARFTATASHHIEVVNNVVANGALTLNLSDFLLVDGNEVYGSSQYFNLVSILNPQNITGDKTIRNRIIVRNNIIHDNKWTRDTDGNGMIFDNGIERQLANYDISNFPALDENRVPWASYTMGGIIDNNIFYGNNGPGLTLYNARGVTVRNNISTNNNRGQGREGPWAGQIVNTNGNDNVFRDNVTVTPGTKDTYGLSCQYFKDYSSPTFKRNENTTWIGNTTCDLSAREAPSVRTQNTCPIPAGSNKLGDCASLGSLGLLNSNPPTRFVVDCGFWK